MSSEWDAEYGDEHNMNGPMWDDNGFDWDFDGLDEGLDWYVDCTK